MFTKLGGKRSRTSCSLRWGLLKTPVRVPFEVRERAGWSVCMHIINTCAARRRCESESFSTKWSGSRGRNKETCSCQGSASQRLLLEIFWKKKKSHVWRLSALLSSHFKLRSVEWLGERKEISGGRGGVGTDEAPFWDDFYLISSEDEGEPHFLFQH